MGEKVFCPHCEAPMVVYKRRLGQTEVRILVNMLEQSYPIKLNDVRGVTSNTYGDFKRLTLWGFLAKADTEQFGSRAYYPTTRAIKFLRGELKVHKIIHTYRNKIQADETSKEPLVGIADIDKELRNRDIIWSEAYSKFDNRQHEFNPFMGKI